MNAVTLPVAVHATAAVAVVYAAGTSAFLLYRTPNPRLGKRSLPVVTLTILAVITGTTGLQLIFPEELNALRRNPSAFSADEWWRLVTPMFVQSDGWPQIIFNFLGIALIGPIVEWIFGGRR
jgi:membrane associated rhomboid family serine protease